MNISPAPRLQFTRIRTRIEGGQPLTIAYADVDSIQLVAGRARRNALASSWLKAFSKAQEEGFRSLGAAEEAYFDVRIAA